MQVFDLKFDNGLGDAQIDEDAGVLKIVVSETNPEFPSGLTINVPLDPIFQKLEAQSPNFLVTWGEKAAQALLDTAD